MELIIRPILPSPRDYPGNIIPLIDSAIHKALIGDVAYRTKRAMEDRTSYWDKPPDMGSRYRRPSRDVFQLHVFPTGNEKAIKRWKWVSQGTYPYTIVVKSAPFLRYQHGYVPYTQPGNRYGNVSGGTYTGDYAHAIAVVHPGIEARNFEDHVVQQIRKDVIKDIQAAITLAVR